MIRSIWTSLSLFWLLLFPLDPPGSSQDDNTKSHGPLVQISAKPSDPIYHAGGDIMAEGANNAYDDLP